MQDKNILCEERKLKIKWEDSEISIPLNFENMNEAILYRVVRGMQNQMSELKQEVGILREEQEQYIIYKFQDVAYAKAKTMIISYLRKIKKEVNEMTLFEISQRLKLPANQVEKVIEELEKENKVKWVEI
ncbi:hypothetical protein BMS3Abin17_01296 [archaeon BMS3Abin17]|nr:hypothetical protein BMS3Abin17_01296 [archaeon BMS3Abin17]